MLRKWATLAAIAGSIAWAIAGAPASRSRAGDDQDKPLKKLMKTIDARTKSIRDAMSSVAKFKKAGNGKDLVPIAGEIARLGKETREFKEPSEAMKKPYEKWVDMNDRFVAAAGEVARAAGKGDLVGTRKAWSSLNLSCSNCHGAFRPEVGDGF
jgi:cytochrome c556